MSESDTNDASFQGPKPKQLVPTRVLIRMVRERRCLWDRTCPVYRDKVEKDKAWHEIYKTIEPNFDSLDQAKKNLVGSRITRKWHNARDSYVKSRKGNIRNRPYIYSEELAFLDSTLRPSRKTSAAEDGDGDDGDQDQDVSQTWMSEVFVDIDEGTPENGMSKRQKLDYDHIHPESPRETPKEDNEESIVSVLVNLIQKEEDEDRAFFKSITPSVKTLSESSKFEFRIQVMKLIKSLKMKDRKMLNVNVKCETASNAESDSE